MKLRQARYALALLLVAVAVATAVMLRRQPVLPAPVSQGAAVQGWSASSLPAGERRRLRFLVRTDCPPFSSVPGENEEPVGLDADVARELAAQLGVEYNLVPLPCQEVVSRFLRGEGDVLAAAVSLGSPHERFLDFTVPYYRSRGTMLVTDTDAERWSRGLPANARLGLLTGAAHSDALLHSLGNQALTVETSSWDELVACLQDNRCDAVLTDALTAYYQLSSHPDCGLSLLPIPILSRYPSAVSLAVRKGATDLRHSLDTALRDMEMDGTLRRMHHRYFPFNIE